MIASPPVLLDTHVLLWLVSTPEKVAPAVRHMLAEPSTEVVVSAASAWEVAIKTRLGRLNGETLLSAWHDILSDMTATDLPIHTADIIFAGRLAWDPKDPFDRILVAQAARRNLTVVTNDHEILGAALTPTIKT